MTEPNAIVTAGIGDLFPLVVFAIIVIAQLIKKAQREGGGRASSGTSRRSHPRPRPSAPSPPRTMPRPGADSGDDLLDGYLEELAGVRRPQPPPAPPPVPSATRARQSEAEAAVAKARERKRVEKSVAWDDSPVHQPAEPAGVAGVAGVADVAAVSDWGQRCSPGVAVSSLRRGLKMQSALRDAILMREILGPPLALRNGNLPRK